MKKVITLLLFLILSASSFSQNKDLYQNALFQFEKYQYGGRMESKVKADSLLAKYFTSQGQDAENKVGATIIKILLNDDAKRSNSFKSSEISSSIKNDKNYIAFKNIFELSKNQLSSESLQSLRNDSLYIEKQGGAFRPLYFKIVANQLYGNKNFGLGAIYCKRALTLIKNVKKFKPVELYKFLGANYYMTGKRDLAVYNWDKAYELAKIDLPLDHKNLDDLSWNLGVVHMSNGEYEKSIPYFLEAAKQFELAHGNKPYLISKYAVLSDAYFYTYDYKRAEIAAAKAKYLADEVIKTEDPYLMGLVAATMSRIYSKQGKFNEARKLLDPALQNTLATYGEASSLSAAFTSDKAKLEWKAGNLEVAKTHFNNAIKMAEMTDRIYTKTAALNDMIYFLIATNNYQEAKIYLSKEKKLLVQNNDTLSMVFNVNKLNLINVLIVEKDYNEAERLLVEHKHSIEKFSNVGIELIDNLQLSLIIKYNKYLNSKDKNLLSEVYNESNDFLKKLVKQKSSLDYDESKIFYGENIAEYIPPALDIIYEKIQLNPSSEVYTQALRFMEINKSSTLLNGLKQSTLAKTYGVDNNIISTKDSLNNKLNDIGLELDAISGVTDTALKKPQLIKDQLDTQNKIDEINKKLKIDYPSYFKASTLSLSEDIAYYQKNVLDKNEIVLEYFLSSENLYRLQLSKDNIVFDKILGTEKLADKIEKFRNSLIGRKNIDAEIESISKLLLPELPQSITRLTIIADDVLGTIPFEILTLNNKMLLEICTLRYAGSLQLLDEQIKTNSNSKKNWAGFAPSYKNGTLGNNVREVTSIKKMMKGDQLTVLGNDATKLNFLKNAPDYNMLHLSVHGFLDQVNPMKNGLLFSDDTEDNELSLQEIYGLSLNAKLAVLSACNTGSGKYEKGDGVMSLSRAFNFAGVSSTIVSLWQVPDKETSQIMIAFYKYLQEGKTKDKALQMAKLDFIASTDDTSLKHPYYWSGFILVGDAAAINNSFAWWWYVAGVALIFLLLFVGVKFFKPSLFKSHS